jgi:hypothetical protein
MQRQPGGVGNLAAAAVATMSCQYVVMLLRIVLCWRLLTLCVVVLQRTVCAVPLTLRRLSQRV